MEPLEGGDRTDLLKGIGQPFDVNDARTDLVLRSIEILKRIDRDGSVASAKKAS